MRREYSLQTRNYASITFNRHLCVNMLVTVETDLKQKMHIPFIGYTERLMHALLQIDFVLIEGRL